MPDVPPGQLGDLVKLMIVVLGVVGAACVALVKVLRDQSETQRTHEKEMAGLYGQMGDKFTASLKDAVGDLRVEIRESQADICRYQECPNRIARKP